MNQKSVTLTRLQKYVQPVSFGDLKKKIHELVK